MLLGVNSDASRSKLKKVIAKEKIVWRNWFDGGGTEGPIATKWQITAWSTVYILDAKGVIRHIESGGETPDAQELGKVIDKLLKELAATKNKKK